MEGVEEDKEEMPTKDQEPDSWKLREDELPISPILMQMVIELLQESFLLLNINNNNNEEEDVVLTTLTTEMMLKLRVSNNLLLQPMKIGQAPSLLPDVWSKVVLLLLLLANMHLPLPMLKFPLLIGIPPDPPATLPFINEFVPPSRICASLS